MTTIAAWGGGVNSTAMIVEWRRRQLPLDLVLFADTGGEKPETYDFLAQFQDWIKAHSDAEFAVVRANSKDASLEAECLRTKGLPSRAYGLSRCSHRWKREPQDIFCNNWKPAREAWARGEKAVKLIGFDAGEQHRIVRVAGKDEPKYEMRYPLVEWGMARDECVAAIRAADLPVPPKSACFFCPSSRVQEIFDLRDKHPDLIERALAMEANAELRPGGTVGLGRRFSWRALLEEDRRQLKFDFHVPELPCACYDGEDE